MPGECLDNGPDVSISMVRGGRLHTDDTALEHDLERLQEAGVARWPAFVDGRADRRTLRAGPDYVRPPRIWRNHLTGGLAARDGRR